MVLVVKNLPSNVGDVRDAASIPGSEISPRAGNGHPLKYSCLKIPWTEEPSRLWPIGSQRIRHGRSKLVHEG